MTLTSTITQLVNKNFRLTFSVKIKYRAVWSGDKIYLSSFVVCSRPYNCCIRVVLLLISISIVDLNAVFCCCNLDCWLLNSCRCCCVILSQSVTLCASLHKLKHCLRKVLTWRLPLSACQSCIGSAACASA